MQSAHQGKYSFMIYRASNIDKIKIPEWKDPKFTDGMYNNILLYNILDSNIFVGYVPNFSGWRRENWFFFQKREF